jgi:hypothetical protein
LHIEQNSYWIFERQLKEGSPCPQNP